MSNDIVTMTQDSFFDVLRQAQAYAWDAAVASMVYPDGSTVELMSNTNPYHKEESK